MTAELRKVVYDREGGARAAEKPPAPGLGESVADGICLTHHRRTCQASARALDEVDRINREAFASFSRSACTHLDLAVQTLSVISFSRNPTNDTEDEDFLDSRGRRSA